MFTAYQNEILRAVDMCIRVFKMFFFVLLLHNSLSGFSFFFYCTSYKDMVISLSLP